MEFVYVVKRYDLFERSFPHGFVPLADREAEIRRYLDRIREHGFFVERRRAEDDSQMKQIIPYALVTAGDEVLLLRRLGAQSEARLHEKLSVGVGGHLEPMDGTDDVLRVGLQRELEEELHLPERYSAEPVGVINDESTDVGSVHFGVAYRIDLDSPQAAVRESDKMEGRFVPRAELARLHGDDPGRFESWSSFLVDHLGSILRPARALR